MNNSIRILHVLGGLRAGGAEAFVMNIYRAIDRNKVQFDFIKHTEEQGVFEEEIIRLGGRIYVCPRYTVKNHFEYCSWWKRFFVNYPEYKIVHAHVRSTAAIYLGIAKKNGCIAIAHSHSTSNGKGIPAVVKNCLQFPIRYIADYMLACSDEAGKWLFGKKAINQNKYWLIPNVIDCQRFSYSSDHRRAVRRTLNLTDVIVIGHVGRFTEAKNHSFLLEVFAEICNSRKDVRLLLVGDGMLKREIELKSKLLGVADKIIMVGEKVNTEDYYQAMDLFVFPSLWEGLGIAVVEAQASGLPVVISERIPQSVITEENVEVLSLNEGASIWAKKIIQLLETSSRNEKEPEKTWKKFDVVQVAQKLQEFYLEQQKLK